MSAFIVTDDHVNALVSFALTHRVSYYDPAQQAHIEITGFNAPDVAAILVAANLRSVLTRYSDMTAETAREEFGHDEPFKYAEYWTPLEPIEAIKAAQCLDYQ